MRVMTPVVSVPVLSKATSVTRADCSIASPLRNRIPDSAPRPLPTMTAVGVASPRAQGQAMIRTATAACNAVATSAPDSSQPTRRGRPPSTTTGTNTAETRSARCWTGALEFCASSTALTIPASGGAGPIAVARDQETPVLVDGRAVDGVARMLLDRKRLAGEHALIDRGLPVDHFAIRRDLPSGRTTMRSPNLDLHDGNHGLDAVGDDHSLAGTEFEQPAYRRRGASPGLGFQGTAQEHKRHDDCRHFEVDLFAVATAQTE